MADLDPATLEKFQRFQAMLAASPEIVEALNSPEILALAAKTAAEQKQQQQQGYQQPQPVIAPTPPPPPPAPKPPPSAPVTQYPIVGYGVSDDISVLSEMTTPTVMTRQTVEEDEFYPEVNGAGRSSSGIGGGPRRIGLRIGVSATAGGRLPPPPPKSSKARQQLRPGRIPRKARAMAAPMSKIAESHDAADRDNQSTDEESDIPNPPARMGTSWSPSERSRKKESEAHPYLGTVEAGKVPRPARQSTYNTRNRRINGRGVIRNRSAPNSLQRMSVSSMSGSSATDGDDNSTFISSVNSTTANSESTAVESNQKALTTQKVRSKASMSTPQQRGVIRNRSMPLKADDGNTNTSTEGAFKAVGDSVVSSSRSLSDGDEETIMEKGSTAEKSSVVDGDAKDVQSAGEKTPRTKNAPRMRLVPIVGKNEASSTRLIAGSSLEPRKPRSRSLSKYSNKNLRGNISSSDDDDTDDNVSRSSAPISNKSLTQQRKPRSRSISTFSNRSLTSKSSTEGDGDDKDIAVSSKSLQQRQPRSRSLSKFSNRKLRDSRSDTDDDASRSSAPVKSLSASSTESNSNKRLVPADQPKKPRSRSLSKYSNIRDRLRGNNSSDDDDNVSRSSAPAVSSTDSGKQPFRVPRRMPSLTTDEDDYSQPSLPQRVSTGNDEHDKGFASNLSSDAEESDEIDSMGSATKSDSDDSSSEDEKEKRPPVVRRWKPPSNVKSNLPLAFRSSSSSKLSSSNHSGKLSNSNHSGKFSRSNHSHKSSEGKPLKKGRKPAPPQARSMSFTKSGSEDEKESRTEEHDTPSSSDSEDAYVRQTVRKPGQPKPETGQSLYQSPDPKLFEQNFAELNQVIQNDTARPSDYIGADGAFGATRRRGQPKKKTLNRSTTSAPRETGWLGAGGPKKRTWKVKSVKEVS